MVATTSSSTREKGERRQTRKEKGETTNEEQGEKTKIFIHIGRSFSVRLRLRLRLSLSLRVIYLVRSFALVLFVCPFFLSVKTKNN
jgi:hypothetical protein